MMFDYVYLLNSVKETKMNFTILEQNYLHSHGHEVE